MEDQSTVTLDALTGLMDTKEQLLELHKDIFLQTSAGLRGAPDAGVYRYGQRHGDIGYEHVDVKLPNGTLSADKLRIIGGGEVVRFEGNVVMNLDNVPATEASGQPAISPAAPPAAPEPAAQTAKTRSGKPTGPK